MSKESVIRDRTGQRLGIIAEDGSRLVARNISNLPIGYYNPKDDYTRDKNQQIIAKGNVLASLIPRAAGS
jgi:hypothetical protein